MPTNRPTYTALSKMATLIDEIAAWNRLLKKHLAEQKKQLNPGDFSYEYRRGKTGKIVRKNKDGKVSSRL
jgi:hypothetical protein